MPRLTFYRWISALLAVTGTAQMPIFKRYYIADVPGLGWTADFILTHRLHYIGAALLLFWLTRRIILSGLASIGFGRLVLLGALILTGAVRMLKNLPDVSFSPVSTMLIDWTHLGAALALAVAALALPLKHRFQPARRFAR
jgi:hypothetical protein